MERGRLDCGIGWMFAIAAALALVLAILPAIAQAPPPPLIKPIAACDKGKCWMSETDFRLLQKFHADRMLALAKAADLIEQLQAANADLMQRLAHYAGGCRPESRI